MIPARASASGPDAELGRMVRTSKTTAPALQTGVAARPELIAALRETTARLVTVTAPAGYGKTSLLAEWCVAEDRATAWITLDKADNDPEILMRLMATAFASIAPEAAPILEALESGGGGKVVTIAHALSLSLLRCGHPFVLFLDDLHALRDDDCLEAIGIVLAGVPDGSQIVWASRRRTDRIARDRLRASEEIVLAADLRIDVGGAAVIASALGVNADAATLNDWVERCRGWAAGVQMCALLAKRGSASLIGSDMLLADYFDSECLQDLPDDMRDFLLQTSILQIHIPELCDAVAERSDAATLLRELELRQLFVTADRGHRSYRLHPLFREFLRAELDHAAPASVRTLHLRAAHWFEKSGELLAAIDNLVAAGESGSATSLVAVAAINAYEDGQLSTLERWFAAIGDLSLLAAPSVVLVMAWASLLTGTDTATDEWGTLLNRMPSADGPVDGIDLGAAQAMVRAIMMKDGMLSAIRDAQYAVDVEDPASPLRGQAMQVLGSILLHTGNEFRGRSVLDGARHTAAARSNRATMVMCETEFAFHAIKQEDWASAGGHVRAALEALSTGEIDGYVMAAYAHAAAACVELHEGNESGARLLSLAMSERHRCARSVPLIAIPTRLLLIRAHLFSDDRASARILLREIEEVLPMGEGRERLDVLLAFAREAIEEHERFRGHREGGALTLAEQRLLPYLQTHLSRAEIAERLVISRNTVGTQISAIFRKLEVRNRTDAVRRACERGLLG